jgi:DNA repair photolyase
MTIFHVVPRERRGRILKKANFGCLKEIYTINVTNGCALACTYCYARGYSQAPPRGEVELYNNLPFLLLQELTNPHRRGKLELVVFNTASDCFQPHPDILEVTYLSMKTLLDSGVTISFLTKGEIPPRFFRLFRQWPKKVIAQIGLVSLSEGYWQRFEPGAASPMVRLGNIRSLSTIGIIPDVRMDPIIPFVTDNEKEIEQLMRAIKDSGVKRISLSYLHLRPGIARRLERELPPLQRDIIHTCFWNKPWVEVGMSTKTKLIPKALREKGYRRIGEIAQAFGVDSVICSCKNPDLKGGICVPERIIKSRSLIDREKGDQQLTLFPC